MVSISPWRPCHCTGLLLHALLANCWKKKKCSGERTKIYCTMHFGSFDLTHKFKPPARTQVEFVVRLKPREGKGWTRSRLLLDSNLHASTFHPISAAPSPPLTDTRTQVQLLPKQRILATDETRWGRQIMTTSVSCPFPSSETREQRRRREKSRFGAEQEANSRGVRMDVAQPVCRRSAENTTNWQCLSRLCLCVFVPPSARHCLAKAVVEGSIPLLKC